MPARLNPRHSDMVRQKIQASNLVNRLQGHVFDGVEMSKTQITAAIALLDRSVAKLQNIQITGDEGGPVKIEVVQFANDSDSK